VGTGFDAETDPAAGPVDKYRSLLEPTFDRSMIEEAL
jgi:hypothetical protein